MTKDTPTVEEIVEKFQRRFGNSAPRIAMRSPDDCDELAEWLQTTLTKVAEEARKEERERMRAEVMRILDIQHSGVRQDTDFEKGYTTAYKNMSAHLSEK